MTGADLSRERSVGRAELAGDFRRIGVRPGSVLLLHSSLSSIGRVEHGPDTVIDALLDALGPSGTLMVPTLPFRGYQYDYLQADPCFDPATTPSLVGAITEAVRRRPGARRSLHPSHSVAALGPAADHLTAPPESEPWETFGRASPFGRLVNLDGSICLLGVTHRSSTFLHAVEEQNRLAYFAMPEPVSARVLVDGVERRVWTTVGRPGVSRHFDNVEAQLIEHNALSTGRVGAAPTRLMSARRVMSVVSNALAVNPRLLLKESPPAGDS